MAAVTTPDEHTAAQQTVPQPAPVREEPDTTTCCTSLLLCPVHDWAFHPSNH